MSSRMRRPETAKLEISQGDWLLVKKHLTAGETRAMFASMTKPGPDGDVIDRSRYGIARIIAYLLDWSITDAEDKPVVIRDQPTAVVASALDALDVDSFTEILDAIEAHAVATAAALAQEKNVPAGATASSAISPSVA